MSKVQWTPALKELHGCVTASMSDPIAVNSGVLERAYKELYEAIAELEAERGKVRELREAIEKAKSIVYGGREVCDMMDKDVAREYKEAANAFDKALANTNAPTDTEIRAKRDREIADWLESSAKEYEEAGMEVPYPASRLQELANELRQRASTDT